MRIRNYLNKNFETILIKILFLLKPNVKYSKFYVAVINSTNHKNKNQYWKLLKYIHRNIALSHSHDFQDLHVLFELQTVNRFYLEIGAGDGSTKSNCFALEKQGWEGILIEPNPKLFKNCDKNRSEKTTKINKAIVSSKYTKESITLYSPETIETMGTIVGANSYTKLMPGKVLEYQVDTISIEQIRQIIPNTKKIDYISLDIEGYELEILEEILNVLKPKMISVEHNFQNLIRLKYKEIFGYYGYIEKYKGLHRNDAMYVRKQ
jgi:FkbM family methyltransferase